jgi:iron complex transport system ATP-binding protein
VKDFSAAARLEGRGLQFAYRKRMVLQGVDIAIGAGEVVSLLGANGAGKSTLLKLLLGFLPPAEGAVLLNGEPLSSLSRRQIGRRLAYVPQVHVTPFPYTVREVVTLGRLPGNGVFRAPSASDREAVDEVLERLRITHLAGRPYTEVSGGERQLALIGRALAQGPRVLVMDEPMTSLDFGYQVRLARRLSALAAEGRAVVLSTHDPQFALQTSTRIALLIGGRIEADGAPGDVATPAAMRRLYGVDVQSFTLPNGKTVFFSSDFSGPNSDSSCRKATVA